MALILEHKGGSTEERKVLNWLGGWSIWQLLCVMDRVGLCGGQGCPIPPFVSCSVTLFAPVLWEPTWGISTTPGRSCRGHTLIDCMCRSVVATSAKKQVVRKEIKWVTAAIFRREWRGGDILAVSLSSSSLSPWHPWSPGPRSLCCLISHLLRDFVLLILKGLGSEVSSSWLLLLDRDIFPIFGRNKILSLSGLNSSKGLGLPSPGRAASLVWP